MSWRDELIPASFRGVPFHVSSAERSGGRRGVTHEYPGRDTPFREDLGRKARSFTLEAFVLGPDYFAARNALLGALEEYGPGELRHPYYGPLRAAVTSFTVRETNQDGGQASFSITLEETPDAPAQPTAVPNTRAAALSSVAHVTATLSSEFLAAYVVGPRMGAAVAALSASAEAVGAAADAPGLSAQERAALWLLVDGAVSSAATLAESGQDVLDTLVELFGAMLSGALAVYGFDPGERPAGTTANRLQEQANFDALQRLTQRLAVVRAAELALDATYESYEAAVAAREAVTEPLDEQAELAGDDLYAALVQLRADLVKAIPGTDSALGRLITYTPPVTVPSLVLAYQLWGDLASEADLLARNSVVRPGFLPAGQPLEVLTRA